ncbi:unnamed protein product [Lampetra planeri]
MGRKKIQIAKIMDERNRQVTFTKRKFGLMKKAYELSVLCNCEIALIIFNSSNKLFQYASTDMDKVLLKYTEYSEPHESRTNSDILETLRKKGMNGCESPEGDVDELLGPHSPMGQDKFLRDDGDMTGRVSFPPTAPTHPIHVRTFPHQSTNLCCCIVPSPPRRRQIGHPPRPPILLLVPHPPPRPPSSSSSPILLLIPPSSSSRRSLLGGDLTVLTGAGTSPLANGYPHQRGSPGILGPGGHVIRPGGGGLAAKSPPPPQGHPLRKPDLRAVVPQSCKNPAGSMVSAEITAVANQRLTNSHALQALVTPSQLSSYQPNYSTEYALSSADLSGLTGFNSPGSLSISSLSNWHHQQGTNINQLLSCGYPSVKSEPLSPSRDPISSGGGPGYPGAATMQRQDPLGRPSERLSPYEGGEPDDPCGGTGGDYLMPAGMGRHEASGGEGPLLKRARLTESWAT